MSKYYTMEYYGPGTAIRGEQPKECNRISECKTELYAFVE